MTEDHITLIIVLSFFVAVSAIEAWDKYKNSK